MPHRTLVEATAVLSAQRELQASTRPASPPPGKDVRQSSELIVTRWRPECQQGRARDTVHRRQSPIGVRHQRSSGPGQARRTSTAEGDVLRKLGDLTRVAVHTIQVTRWLANRAMRFCRGRGRARPVAMTTRRMSHRLPDRGRWRAEAPQAPPPRRAFTTTITALV